MNRERNYFLKTAWVVLLLAAVDSEAGETWTDTARVIEVKPLYSTENIPVEQEVCSMETDRDVVSAAQSTDSNDAESNDLVRSIYRDIELSRASESVYRCRIFTRLEQRETIVAYKVRYEYGNEIYERRMDQNPGGFIKVRVRLDPRP